MKADLERVLQEWSYFKRFPNSFSFSDSCTPVLLFHVPLLPHWITQGSCVLTMFHCMFFRFLYSLNVPHTIAEVDLVSIINTGSAGKYSLHSVCDFFVRDYQHRYNDSI